MSGRNSFERCPGHRPQRLLHLALLLLAPLCAAASTMEFRSQSLRPAAGEFLTGQAATALASADFDEDGIDDLAVATASDTSAGVLLLRGGLLNGEVHFREVLGTFALGAPADRLLSGDYDADGHLDLLATRLGTDALMPLLGDGRGGLRPGPPVLLPGRLTAIAAGEVNRRDGLADLVVAHEGGGGFELLVYEDPAGVLAASPEAVSLPAPARAIALGDLDGTFGYDIVAAADAVIVLVRGRDARRAGALAPTLVEHQPWSAPIRALAVGEFAPARRGRELALLDETGRLGILAGAPGSAAGVDTPGQLAWSVIAEIETGAAKDAQLLPYNLTGGVQTLILHGAGQPAKALTLRHGRSEATALVASGKALAGLDGTAQLLAQRLDGDARADLISLPGDGSMPRLLRPKGDPVISVTSALDDAIGGDGACTLREAINNANADADTTGGDCAAGAGSENISFIIDGGGAAQTIVLASELPEITSPVTLDATSQCPEPPCVELDGSGLTGSEVDAFTVLGGASTVRGFVINGFPRSGVSLTGQGGNVVAGNYIGTDLDGSAAVGLGGTAIFITSDDNVIGGRTAADRNVLSGLTRSGVAIFGGTGNRIEGNHIGVDAAGAQAVANADAGVFIGRASGNTIGGTAPGAGNVLSANRWGLGIRRFDDTNDATEDNLVQGNLIGTDASGALAIGNDAEGIFIFDAPNNTIGGTTEAARNVVSGNGFVGDFAPYSGVLVTPFVGLVTTGNLIQGNYLGTNAAGDAALPNADAGVLLRAARETQVGGIAASAGNLISGNVQAGISFVGTGGGSNVIQGNRIGTNAAGTEAVPNGGQGIYLQDHTNNLIGGTAAGAGNLVSGNDGFGIHINANGNDNTVQGNLVGTTLDGLSALPNATTGVFVTLASGNVIGGTGVGARNVVSGNGIHGVQLFGTSNIVQGNYIGVDVTGSAPLGNGDLAASRSEPAAGVFIGTDSANNTIGGTEDGAENVISANRTWGVFLGNAAPGNLVQGNLIGTDAAGSALLGNDSHGVSIFDADGQIIGGPDPAAGNTIAGSGENGVFIGASSGLASSDNVVEGNTIRDSAGNGIFLGAGTGNRFTRNAIFDNGGLAIALDGDGRTPNDPQDADTGANNLQNFPELESATPGSTVIAGTINTTPGTMITVEFFSSTDCLLTEAGVHLETIQVMTDADGDADVGTTLGVSVDAGRGITATATDPGGNTSELSDCVPVATEVVFADGFEVP